MILLSSRNYQIIRLIAYTFYVPITQKQNYCHYALLNRIVLGGTSVKILILDSDSGTTNIECIDFTMMYFFFFFYPPNYLFFFFFLLSISRWGWGGPCEL